MNWTHSSGYRPVVVSPESMIASAVDQTALAMSLTSARVGTGEVIMDSSRWVATMTGLRCRMQASTARFWNSGRVSIGTSIPRSPRAIITASEATMISSRLVMPDWSSTFAMMRAVLFELREQPPEDVDVVGLANKRKREEVDLLLDAYGDVGAVLCRQGRQADLHAGKVDVAPAVESCRHDDAAAHARRGRAQHLQPNEAAVDQDDGPLATRPRPSGDN